MAITLSNIRGLVRSELDEASPVDWTNSDLNMLINTWYHRVYTNAVGVYSEWNILNSTFNTVANQQEYGTSDGLPSGIFKIRRIEINYNASGVAASNLRALPIPSIDAVRRDLGNNNIGMIIFSQPYYYFLAQKVGFIPIPQYSTANAIKIWYTPTLSDLSADSDQLTIPYPERYYQIVVNGALSEALRFGQQDSSEADKYEQKALAGLVQMENDFRERVEEESKSVIDVTGEYIDFGGLAY